MRIFDIWFWRYLFRKADDPTYTFWWRRLICRWQYHPCGEWYYRAYGTEPDHSCKNCGDIIG